MNITTNIKKRGAKVALAVVAAAGAGGVVWAAAGSPSGGSHLASLSASTTPSTPPTPSGTGPAAGRHGGHGGGDLLRRTDHATVEVKSGGQWVTYTLDRGKVTAVSPTSITLLRPDGQSVTLAIGASTRFGPGSSESSIVVGKPAEVISLNGTAVRIRQPEGRRGGAGASGSSGTSTTTTPSPATVS